VCHARAREPLPAGRAGRERPRAAAARRGGALAAAPPGAPVAGGLADLLAAVAAGRPPAADGSVTVLPRAAGGAVAAVLGFTGRHVVAADVEPGWVRSVLPPGSLSAPLSARFLAALADRVGAEPGALDVVLLAPPAGGPLPELRPTGGVEHPRLSRAERYRTGVRAYAVEGALLVLGRGLAGRWEVSLEVDPAYRERGLGRRLLAAAPALVPPGEPLWAQVAPANVASLRAFLAAGYRPAGAEVLLA
jgi:GNAT superfamily N-acetyltransferase